MRPPKRTSDMNSQVLKNFVGDAFTAGIMCVLVAIFDTKEKQRMLVEKLRQQEEQPGVPSTSRPTNVGRALRAKEDAQSFAMGLVTAMQIICGTPESRLVQKDELLQRIERNVRIVLGSGARQPSRVPTTKTPAKFAGGVHTKKPYKVYRRPKAYWEEKGWKREGDVWEGYYRTAQGAYKGVIKRRFGDTFEFIIWDPPDELSVHPKRPCFIRQSDGNRYIVHFSRKGKTIDDGIMAIENIMRECLARS